MNKPFMNIAIITPKKDDDGTLSAKLVTYPARGKKLVEVIRAETPDAAGLKAAFDEAAQFAEDVCKDNLFGKRLVPGYSWAINGKELILTKYDWDFLPEYPTVGKTKSIKLKAKSRMDRYAEAYHAITKMKKGTGEFAYPFQYCVLDLISLATKAGM
mgnify:FL=1|tara:strand:+ start:1830 stop:2300 length:471 start_codon:yes stop_codon:yes gene_type:complete